MQKVKALLPGSTIGIVAPASDVNEDAFRAGCLTLQQLGFRVKFSDKIFDKRFYFAGPHRERAQELMRMFEDPLVDAIFCARGGYGCIHLVRHLNCQLLRRYPKIFMGYSDVTVLLQYLENACEMVGFHGPMVAREFALGEPFFIKENLLRCLTQSEPGHRIASDRLETLRPGTARGRLTGGCLSLLTATLGTPYEIQTKDKILFIEDVNAKPYQIDRMLMQMILAGKLEKVLGMIFGQMLGCIQDQNQGYRLQDILLATLSDFNFPIVYGLPSGHTETGMLTLPLGVHVLLNAHEGYIELEEGAVE